MVEYRCNQDGIFYLPTKTHNSEMSFWLHKYGKQDCGFLFKEINYSHTQSEDQNVGASHYADETHRASA
jgi:hypothetical protein